VPETRRLLTDNNNCLGRIMWLERRR